MQLRGGAARGIGSGGMGGSSSGGGGGGGGGGSKRCCHSGSRCVKVTKLNVFKIFKQPSFMGCETLGFHERNLLDFALKNQKSIVV